MSATLTRQPQQFEKKTSTIDPPYRLALELTLRTAPGESLIEVGVHQLPIRRPFPSGFFTVAHFLASGLPWFLMQLGYRIQEPTSLH